MKMTIANALVYKKRVQGAIAKATTLIQCNNSIDEENKSRTNFGKVRETIAYRARLVDHLRELKLKLEVASLGIREKIFILADLKEHITFLNGVPTIEGVNTRPYSQTGEKCVTVAEVKENEKMNMIVLAEEKIDEVQSVITVFNNTTLIDIEKMSFIN